MLDQVPAKMLGTVHALHSKITEMTKYYFLIYVCSKYDNFAAFVLFNNNIGNLYGIRNLMYLFT